MDGTSIRLTVSTVIPDVFTEPRDLAVLGLNRNIPVDCH